MAELHIIHTSTGQEPDAETLEHLCNGKHAAYLGSCGIDTRKLYAVHTAHPVTYRMAHHQFEATMYRPTRRERISGWWQTYRLAILRDAVLAASFVVAVIIAAIVLHAFVDVLAALIARVLP